MTSPAPDREESTGAATLEPAGADSPALLFVPQTWADPYPVFGALRAGSPVMLTLPPGPLAPAGEPARLWVLLKHDDVYGALRDHGAYSSDFGNGGGEVPKLVLLNDDPPRHGRMRRLVNKVFTPRRIADQAPWIQAIADELRARIGEEETDFVASYAIPLPVRVIARLMGIPGEDYLTFKHWSDTFIASHGVTPQEQAAGIQQMIGYFGRMAAERRAQGAEDLITALVQADGESDRLEEWEVLGFCILLLIAGNETTTNLLSAMFNLLADRPELWQRLRADRGLIEPVIEETLRLESPVQFLQRRATREVVFPHATIPEGAEVLVGFGAANRDPAAFPEPDAFRLDRDLRSHVAFGMGIHYCLGAPLARLEAAITLNTFLDRYTRVERGAGPAVRQTASPIVYGFTQLPLRFGE